MSSSTSVAAQNGQPSTRGVWPSLAPYLLPPASAASAIVLVFRGMIAKSALQKGLPVPQMTLQQGMREGLKAAPTVGGIIGMQMVAQNVAEKTMVGDANKNSLPPMVGSSAFVGLVSAPALAVFNGQTMGLGVSESLRKFSAKQAFATGAQETLFVLGVRAAKPTAAWMKQKLGDNRAVECFGMFTSGYIASLSSHAANTAAIRWQSGLKIDNWRQLTWGAATRARATGGFVVGYNLTLDFFKYVGKL